MTFNVESRRRFVEQFADHEPHKYDLGDLADDLSDALMVRAYRLPFVTVRGALSVAPGPLVYRIYGCEGPWDPDDESPSLLYVGGTINFALRWKRHGTRFRYVDRIALERVPNPAHIADLEQLAIHLERPLLNGAGVTTPYRPFVAWEANGA